MVAEQQRAHIEESHRRRTEIDRRYSVLLTSTQVQLAGIARDGMRWQRERRGTTAYAAYREEIDAVERMTHQLLDAVRVSLQNSMGVSDDDQR